jgi:hypothetical protein
MLATMAIVNRSGNNDAMQLGINHQNSGATGWKVWLLLKRERR